MRRIKTCPICGSRMNHYKDGLYNRLACSKCPLDFGRNWYTRQDDLIDAWNRRIGDSKDEQKTYRQDKEVKHQV